MEEDRNVKMIDERNRDLHHSFANGFQLKKGQAKVWHPYTLKTFKFDSDDT